MKRLKFSEPLPSLILSGKKWDSWRINDEKGIAVGDELSLCRLDGSEFAKAKVFAVWETTFGKLNDKDREGHEVFSSDEEMYETYSRYYKMKVTPETKVKIIKYKLL